MKKRISGTIISLSLISMLLASGCGSSDSAASKSADYDAVPYAAEESAAYDGGIYDASYDNEVVDVSEGGSAEEVTESQATKKSSRKLITNMSMTTETKEFDKTVNFLQNRTDELGGYVESFSTSKSSYNNERTAYLTLRVPEEKLSGFVNEVAEKSNITSQDMNVTDVTLTYADLESHRNALRAEEEQLLRLMEKAESIEDIMSIQDKLTDVRYQLESMESQLRTYDNQISYSTLKVTVEEVIDYTPEPVKNPTFAERARDGFIENCKNVATFFTELALLIITHIVSLTIIVIIIIFVVIIIRKAEKKRKARIGSTHKTDRMVVPNNGNFAYGPIQGQPVNQNFANQQPNQAFNNQMPNVISDNKKPEDKKSDDKPQSGNENVNETKK